MMLATSQKPRSSLPYRGTAKAIIAPKASAFAVHSSVLAFIHCRMHIFLPNTSQPKQYNISIRKLKMISREQAAHSTCPAVSRIIGFAVLNAFEESGCVS
jgi:hypothetical protein